MGKREILAISQLFTNPNGIKSVRKLMVLGLLIYVLLKHCLQNCSLRYLAAINLHIALVQFSVYVKNLLCCLVTVTFLK